LFFSYKGFHEYRAYFLAAAGIGELQACSWANEIVKQIIKWSFGEFSIQFQMRRTYVPRQIAEQAKAILPKTHRPLAVEALINLMYISPDEYTRIEATEILGQIHPKHPEALALLLDLIYRSPNQPSRFRAAISLGKIAPEHPEANVAVEPSSFQQAIKAGQINPCDSEVIAYLVDMVRSSTNKSIRMEAVKSLRYTISGHKESVKVLLDLIHTNIDTDEDILREAVWSLGRIGKSDPEAIDLLIELSCKSQNWVIRWRAVQGLYYTDTSHEKVIRVLIELIHSTSDQQIRIQAAQSLGYILQRYPFQAAVSALKDWLTSHVYNKDFDLYRTCYEVLLHSAQNMTYPAFYQAWHQQEEVDNTTTPNNQSLNQADLPQSLHSAIANDSQLSQTIHLICIDGSNFIEPDRPAAEIYDQMLDQNCPECDSVPETMQTLKLYWKSLKRNSDKRLVLVFYASSTNPYSEAFLTALSKFKGDICVVTSPPTPLLRGEGSKSSSGSPSSPWGEGVRGWGSLQFFAPSQAIANILEWIRAN